MQTISLFLISLSLFLFWLTSVIFIIFRVVVSIRCSKGIHFWEDSVLRSSGIITCSCHYCGKTKYV